MEVVTVKVSSHVKNGTAQMIVRCRLDDMRDITKAAALLGFSRSQFVRNVLVQTARTIIAEKASEAA